MLNTPADKYQPYPTVSLPDRRWPEQTITRAPRWLSTDLRDGNQALAEPMDSARKLQFWDLLLGCGFKEIEVAFPSASQTDFNFVRQLIEENRIPDDVTIQVLTQAREDLIYRTFESLRGAKQATVHLYNATAPLFRRLVFGMEKAQIVELATRATRLIRQLFEENPETRWQYEYSPETFCFTEPEFALEICEAVAEIWQPCDERPMVINLPATVEVSTPNVYADQIEYFCRHFSRRRDVCISVHPHNDRGTGVASAELAVMAGADRVEGCLFGNGERTGNVCLVTLAMNLYSQGISPNLDFSDMNRVVETVEACNQLPVHPRHPWAGRLAYTAFSGSHQDAIKKGFDARRPGDRWEMPYLPVDPQDIGCTYEAVIRVNSQSGKSGSAWLIEQNHGLKLPRALQQDFSQHVQQETDRHGKEMTQNALWQLFRTRYGLVTTPQLALQSYRSDGQQDGQLRLTASVVTQGGTRQLEGQGNGLLSAAAQGLSRWVNAPFVIKDYHEHTLGERSDSRSVAYIRCLFQDGTSSWGVGIDSDVARASLQALFNAVSRS
ncbi:2-isopropylmalate synthase [Enterobacter cloacae complex sp. P3B]|uniref:2-isopropylmalate synthase n=1 Tax=unclassified Enterobacter cloacae complex TaxID=2757714 RepID=UPI001866D981|nr:MULTISPECIES: 2-isopropylmalate synthase [unclassified Enterobacter cloacae complex]MBE3179288.1 2-isopropylmalate synthase [Enterobacter cloacae complex sp. P26RS]MBE3434926.1 2-isopropylmalate synthase [Enterobacter cloacae complex sp. P21RS]MBE3460384.1 2-isopropylmalate synthase [Enterobacter cloacae complex sp. P21C]MBE3501299.1 2-isopropylmalate synthase [Enterobacter cloacae complex sp. P2B]MBE3503660.1 2-isopropylmalate synthase [Enterobacter cloacae complex sp. I11]